MNNNISSEKALDLISEIIIKFIRSHTKSNKIEKEVNGNDCTIEVTKVDFYKTEIKHWTDQEGETKLFYIDIGHPNVAEQQHITIYTQKNRTGRLEIKATKIRDNTSEYIYVDFHIDGLDLEYNPKNKAFIIKGNNPFSKIIF